MPFVSRQFEELSGEVLHGSPCCLDTIFPNAKSCIASVAEQATNSLGGMAVIDTDPFAGSLADCAHSILGFEEGVELFSRYAISFFPSVMRFIAYDCRKISDSPARIAVPCSSIKTFSLAAVFAMAYWLWRGHQCALRSATQAAWLSSSVFISARSVEFIKRFEELTSGAGHRLRVSCHAIC